MFWGIMKDLVPFPYSMSTDYIVSSQSLHFQRQRGETVQKFLEHGTCEYVRTMKWTWSVGWKISRDKWIHV